MPDRPVVTLLLGPADRPRYWVIDWPDGSVTEVRRSSTPMRLLVNSGDGWVEVPNDGTLPAPSITDTSD